MQILNDRKIVLDSLENLGIAYEIYEHPPAPTIKEAVKYWGAMKDATHCKNLFFRNHKGNKHYLVIFEHLHQLAIKDLEQKLKQGKISFASEKRMAKYLGLQPGSVSIFGLLNDHDHHVKVFLDKKLQDSKFVSFHPNDNRASLRISQDGFRKFLESSGNDYEFLELY
jgi:Ala-tRNA(Pro) deacylase